MIGLARPLLRASMTSPAVPFFSLWRHRFLIWEMTKRDVLGRYRGSLLGLLWSFTVPLVMLVIYTFVFSYVFKARWGEESATTTDFALFLFAGLIVYSLFSECATKSAVVIQNNASYVKKVVFPLETLVWVTIGSALFHAVVSIGVLLVGYAVLHGSVHWTAVYLPVILLPLVLLTVGVCWFLASLGAFVRDTGQVVGILTTILLYVSPIFYPASVLPADLRPLLFLNPLTFLIEQTRDVIVVGNTPSWFRLGVFTIASAIVAWMGFVWFQKTRKGFGDVV